MAVESAVITVKESWKGETCQVIIHFTVRVGLKERLAWMIAGLMRGLHPVWGLPTERRLLSLWWGRGVRDNGVFSLNKSRIEIFRKLLLSG